MGWKISGLYLVGILNSFVSNSKNPVGMARISGFFLVGMRVQCSFPVGMKFQEIFLTGDDFLAKFSSG